MDRPEKLAAIHLVIGEDDSVFLADFNPSKDCDWKVFLLSSRLDDIQIVLNRDQHLVDRPRSLCYVKETQQLLVGQWSSSGGPTAISIFNLIPPTKVRRSKASNPRMISCTKDNKS